MTMKTNLSFSPFVCAIGCALLWPVAGARADQTIEVRVQRDSVFSLHVPPNPPCGYSWNVTSSGNQTTVVSSASDAMGIFINCSFGHFPQEAEATIVVTLKDKPPCPPGTNVLTYHIMDDSHTKTTAANTQTRDQGDPVNPFTGELVMGEAPDLYLGGPMPLIFTRHYASRLRRDYTIHSALGANWSHNFDFSLIRVSNEISVVTWKGRIVRFTKSGANWNLIGNVSTPFQLVESGANYFFGDPRVNLVYTFNTNGQLTAITDGHGNAHTLTYDSNRLLTSVSDGLGRSLTFTYDPFQFGLTDVSDGTRDVGINAGNEFFGLDSVSDPESSTFYHYDEDGDGSFVLLRAIDHFGNVRENVSSSYNTNGQVVAQGIVSQFSFRDVATNTFNYSDNTTSITNPFGDTRVFTHDSAGRLLTETDEVGKTESFGYDSLGRRIAITNRLGEVTRISYHSASGKPASITRPDGKITSFQYSSRVVNGITLYDLSRITFPDGATELFSRDAQGNMIAFTDRSGQTTTFSYNSHGQPLARTNAAGGVTLYTYNPDATLASVRDPALNFTTFGYDALRRLVALTNADGAFATWQYNGEDRVTAIQDASGALRQFTYGPRHNYLSSFTDGKTNLWQIDYANVGDYLHTITDPDDGVFGYNYDALQRVSSIPDLRHDGAEIDFTYDSRGRTVAVTDFDGNTNSAAYDDAGRAISATDPLGNQTGFTRDNLGRITDFTSPLANVTHVDYDPIGRPTTVRDSEGNRVSLAYDSAGRLLHTDVGYASADYTRDALGLLAGIHDPNGHLWSSPRDSSGRVTSHTDPLGRETDIACDNRNRPAVITFSGSLGGVTNTFDGVGRVLHSQYSDGTDLQFSYDRNGQLISANGIELAYNKRGLVTNANGIAITRDAAGRIETMTLAPGKTVTYSYNNRDLVTSVQDWLGGATTFGYDAGGRMTNIARPNGVNGTYAFDAEGRVASIQEGGIIALAFTRDHAGRVVQVDRTAPVPSAPPAPANFSFDAASQVNGFQYDALGRLLQDSSRGYHWDMASRLLAYTNGASTVSFTYDALGNRLARTNGTANREYVWNYALGLPGISIEKQSGADIRYYVHAPDGSLLYSVDADTGSRQFYHYDETGNTLALTDDSGIVVAGYAWGPYGEATGASGSADNAFTWQGRWGVMAETDTGLFYHRARFYDSASARFLSRDPLPSLDPRRINPYQYAAGNPLRFVDPMGTRDKMAAWRAWEISNPFGIFIELNTIFPGLFGGSAATRQIAQQPWLPLNVRSKFSAGTQIDPPTVAHASVSVGSGFKIGSLLSYSQDYTEKLEVARKGPPPPQPAPSPDQLRFHENWDYAAFALALWLDPIDPFSDSGGGGMSEIDTPSLKLQTDTSQPVEDILDDIGSGSFKDPNNPTREEKRAQAETLVLD
jgi:RHS repeat-associated protein